MTDQGVLPLQPRLGVHLSMPDRIYFGAKAIGSSDLKTLYWDAPSWWAGSDYNPNRRAPQRTTRRIGQDLGSALHALVLEGEGAYRSRFAVEPDDGSPQYVRTRDQVRELLAEQHVKIPRGDFTAATLFRLVRKHGLAHRVFPVARADYEAAVKAGRRHITDDEDRRLRLTAKLIADHPKLGPALAGGLSEVAVFWRRDEDPETLLRAKFDKLRLARVFDLKTIGNWRGRDIDSAIRQAIEENDYDIQRRLYPEAYGELVRFVGEGKVYAWDDAGAAARVPHDDRSVLEQIATGPDPEWVWIFVQIPVDEIGRERAPVIAPRWHAASGRLWEDAGVKVETGLRAFRDYRDRFTLDRPWALIDDVRELIDEDIRSRMKREVA